MLFIRRVIERTIYKLLREILILELSNILKLRRAKYY